MILIPRHRRAGRIENGRSVGSWLVAHGSLLVVFVRGSLSASFDLRVGAAGKEPLSEPYGHCTITVIGGNIAGNVDTKGVGVGEGEQPSTRLYSNGDLTI